MKHRFINLEVDDQDESGRGKENWHSWSANTEFQKRFPFFALTDNAAENHSKMKTFSN